MRKPAQVALWAVYQMTVQGRPGPKVVCLQQEWDTVEAASPGVHRLIKGGIVSEGEAEQLARGVSGNDKGRMTKKLVAEPRHAEDPVIAESGGAAGIEKGRDDVSPPLLLVPDARKGSR
jgi:hypothetical protein